MAIAEVGEATHNVHAERLTLAPHACPGVRTIKEEQVNLSDFRDYADASEYLGRFLDDVYQHKRIYSALGHLTPAEFEQRRSMQQVTFSGIH